MALVAASPMSSIVLPSRWTELLGPEPVIILCVIGDSTNQFGHCAPLDKPSHLTKVKHCSCNILSTHLCYNGVWSSLLICY